MNKNRNYARGRDFEYVVKRKLEAEGWTVWRTPGSKSRADLIAIRGYRRIGGVVPRVRLVQCKSGNARLSKKGQERTIRICRIGRC